MRIAVTYANGEIFQHFGRTEQFKVYDVENGQVLRSQVVGTGGQGHGALAGVLQQLGADVLICGGIGGGAQAALASAGLPLDGRASRPRPAAGGRPPRCPPAPPPRPPPLFLLLVPPCRLCAPGQSPRQISRILFLRLHPQQTAHRNLQDLRHMYQHVRVRHRQVVLPFRDGLPHHM